MTDPISFSTASPRFALPLLFAGQAQKEFFVNEAFARTDMLLHAAIKGEADTPPANPQPGDCWLVGDGATGAWSSRSGHLAGFAAGNWLFAAPRNGVCVYDEAAGQLRRYVDGWQAAEAVIPASGGATVDAEARTAIAGIIAALVAGGILPTS